MYENFFFYYKDPYIFFSHLIIEDKYLARIKIKKNLTEKIL